VEQGHSLAALHNLTSFNILTLSQFGLVEKVTTFQSLRFIFCCTTSVRLHHRVTGCQAVLGQALLLLVFVLLLLGQALLLLVRFEVCFFL